VTWPMAVELLEPGCNAQGQRGREFWNDLVS
jgi:hypothetical protein